MPHSPDAIQTPKDPPTTWSLAPIALIVATLVAIGLIGTIGNASIQGFQAAIASVTSRFLWFLPAVVYIFTGVGLARLLRPITRLPASARAIEPLLGSALILTLSHVLGQLGLLQGQRGLFITLALSAFGLGAFLVTQWRDSQQPQPETIITTPRPAPRLLLSTLATLFPFALFFAVILFAISNPPGALWASEFGGYDVLSYHLQLPQEWLIRGRLESLSHNVYSYLPSYMEAAFLHLAALTNAPLTPDFPHGPVGLLAGSGWRAVSCQALSAAFLIQTTFAFVAIAQQLLTNPTDKSPHVPTSPSTPVLLAQGIAFLSSWPLIVGTLAYNEMPMLALFVGALLAATNQQLSPTKRGLLSGLLVAVASGVKPTALLFVGLPTGILLLGTMPIRHWWKAVLPGILIALAFLAPWMIRNAIASGNPLFPFALTDQLGSAHWTSEQLQRFLHNHISHEPLLDRLKLLILPDTNDPAAAPGNPVFRGMSHPQWGTFFAIAILSISHAVFWLRGPARRNAILLSLAFIIQIALWLFTTHVQSRFLLPLLIPGAALIALAASTPQLDRSPKLGRRPAWFYPRICWISRTGMTAVCILALLAQCAFLIRTLTKQHQGQPAFLLPLDPADFTATTWHTETNPARRNDLVANSACIGIASLVPQSERILLLGDATPFYFPPNCTYNTVWDTWPFEAGRLTDTAARYILIDFASIARYERSGYLPPSVSSEAIQSWMVNHTRALRAWPNEGKVLVEVLR